MFSFPYAVLFISFLLFLCHIYDVLDYLFSAMLEWVSFLCWVYTIADIAIGFMISVVFEELVEGARTRKRYPVPFSLSLFFRLGSFFKVFRFEMSFELFPRDELRFAALGFHPPF